MFCTLAALVLTQASGNVPIWNYTLGLVLNLIAAAALVWRHRFPAYVLALAVAGPLFFSTDATAALIALYALARSERGVRLAAAAGAETKAWRRPMGLEQGQPSTAVAYRATGDSTRPKKWS